MESMKMETAIWESTAERESLRTYNDGPILNLIMYRSTTMSVTFNDLG